MGFWARDRLDQLDLWPPGPSLEGRSLPPPVFPCPWCNTVFENADELEMHTFRGHHQPRPVLLLRGRECGSSLVPISTRTQPEDWATVQVDRAWMNDAPTDPHQLPALLARETNRHIDVRLASKSVEAEFKLQFQIADPSDLEQVDLNLRALAEGRRLDLRAIEEFVRACSELDSASRYYDAFAQYFYGVLARERSPESNLRPQDYRDKYDLAGWVLSQFDTVPARTVSALIAFHFNQFSRAMAAGFDSERLHGAAQRLRRFLLLESHEEPPPTTRRRGFDRLFTDAETERVLDWVTAPFTADSGRLFEEAAAYANSCEPLDQVKLRITLAEYHRRLGAAEEARHHVDAVLHNDLTEDWARSLRAGL